MSEHCVHDKRRVVTCATCATPHHIANGYVGRDGEFLPVTLPRGWALRGSGNETGTFRVLCQRCVQIVMADGA